MSGSFLPILYSIFLYESVNIRVKYVSPNEYHIRQFTNNESYFINFIDSWWGNCLYFQFSHLNLLKLVSLHLCLCYICCYFRLHVLGQLQDNAASAALSNIFRDVNEHPRLDIKMLKLLVQLQVYHLKLHIMELGDLCCSQ